MIFRRPRSSYTITLKRAHSLLKIPRADSTTRISISGEVTQHHNANIPSRDLIQEAFRAAAKRHHPDLVAAQGQKATPSSANISFRECHEARELLLDYYVRQKFIPPEIIESVKDKPPPIEDESLFSVWTSNRSFQIEAFMRLSVCLGLAVGSYYHDLHLPEKRKQQLRQRDEGYYQFGPQEPRF